MTEQKTEAHKERRTHHKQPDPVLKLLIVLSIVGWLTFVLALVLFHYARPELLTGFMHFWNVSVRQYWHESYSVYLIITLVIMLGISGVGTFYRRKRIRRRGDAIWLNLPVLLVLTVGFLLYLVKTLH